MTISELLSDETLRQHEFPVVRDRIFLGHAGVSPLPRRVEQAVARYAQAATLDDQELVCPKLVEEGRQVAARLLHCQPGEVALVGPTSLALNYVAGGLKFRRHDNILVYFDDYPANVYPWMALAEKGVEVRLMNTRGLGVIRSRDVVGQVDENTRLVALASSHFISGYRVELDAIGAALRERRIQFCVDGIQTLGAFPTTVEQVDFLAADAHKWLLGPCGAGLLYVREAAQPYLSPTVFGWNNVECPDYVAREQMVFPKDSRRYECGTHNLLGLAGLVAAMELALELGVENIARELWRKRQWLAPALQEKGYTVLNADAAMENAGGSLSFFSEGKDLTALHEKLTQAKMVTFLRADRAGRKYIRISPHYYNTDQELQRFLEQI
jgi:selenocysteine lyase/cysteine desulfurase